MLFTIRLPVPAVHRWDGECLIGCTRSTRSTSGERVLRVRIRPTVTHAGGETLEAG